MAPPKGLGYAGPTTAGYGNAVGKQTDAGHPEGQYAPRDGESYEAWTMRLEQMGASGDVHASLILKTDQTQLQAAYTNKDTRGILGNKESSSNSIDRKLKEFYDRMTGPLDMNDPEVKQAMATARNVGQSQAAGRGIQGGLSDSGIAKMSIASLAPIQSQRREQGLRALSMSSDRDQYVQGMAKNDQYRTEDYNHRDMIERYNRANAEEQKYFGYATGAMGAVGGLVGGIGSVSGGMSGESTRPAPATGSNGLGGYVNVSNGSASMLRPDNKTGGGY